MSKQKVIILFQFLIISNLRQVIAELLFVVEVCRHGARGPLGNWYDSQEQFDIQGELTATGQRQHYNLGAKLREEYKEFLPDEYDHSQIYVRSTDFNRTHMSAASQMQGMFPEGSGGVLPSNLSDIYTLPSFKDARDFLPGQKQALPNQMQSIPIHGYTSSQDMILQPDANCEKLKELKDEYYASMNETITFINNEFRNTYAQYSLAVNQTVSNFDQIHDIETTFECDRYNGRYVPHFSTELSQNASYLNSLSWNFRYNHPNALRAMNTPFFNQLLAYYNPIVQNIRQNKLKWVIYSAHDTNVHLISAALNLTSIQCLLEERFHEYRQNKQTFYNCEYYPKFASSLLFELHKADQQLNENDHSILLGEYYIRVRRDGSFMNLCQRNSTMCSFQELSQRIQWFSVDFNEVCNQSGNKNSNSERENQIVNYPCLFNEEVYYIGGLVLELLIIIFLGLYIYYKKRKNQIQSFQILSDQKLSENKSQISNK